MKTLLFIRLIIIATFLFSCGVKKSEHYKQTKTYGKSTYDDADPGSDPKTDIKTKDPSSVSNVDSKNNTPVLQINRGLSTTDTVSSIIPVNPDQVVFSGEYHGIPALASLKLINKTNFLGIKYVDPNDFEIGRQILSRINTGADSRLLLRQTAGDGVSRSKFLEDLDTKLGDLGSFLGQPSESGQFVLNRVVNKGDCPNVFICIDRLTFTPTSGTPLTVCFFEAGTIKSTTFPYAPLPNLKKKDFEGKYGFYGPYDIYGFEGSDVECDNPAQQFTVKENVAVMVRETSVDNVQLYLHNNNPLPIQYGLEFENLKTGKGSDERPYLDESLKLQHQTKFFLNEDNGVIIKIIKTIRKSLNIVANPSDSTLHQSASNFLSHLDPFDGIIVDCHFELCENLLDAGSPNYCHE